MPREGDRMPGVLAALGALVLVGGLVLTARHGVAVAPGRIVLLGVGGLVCAAAAALLLRRGGGLHAAAATAEERAAAAERHAESAEERARHAEELQRHAAAARTRAERARAIEREWNRELRDQLGRLYRERRSLADTGDVRELVLHTAIALLEAEKGVLLARRDADGDGRLDLVAAAGFAEDPERSPVVQRFAQVVDAQERIVHEDVADDPEIDNLVAIPVWIADDFTGVVVCANREGGFAEHDDEVLLALGGHAGAALDSARLQAELRASYLGSIRMLTEAIEAKDASLRRHVEHVAAAAMAVGERLGLDNADRERLLFGSLLHDVGKIGIAEHILAKPGRL
ncbi:MAG TPA: GAF domain-containing protein, partial [Solirubrobacteraceae bacterium]